MHGTALRASWAAARVPEKPAPTMTTGEGQPTAVNRPFTSGWKPFGLENEGMETLLAAWRRGQAACEPAPSVAPQGN